MNYSEKILKNLTPNLLKEEFRKPNAHPLTGHCYVASEAAYHLFAKKEGYRPYFLRHEGSPHWFLAKTTNYCGRLILDLTADQFQSCPDYSKAIGKGFLTKQPSKRAQVLMARVKAE
jgi:hypothetical protein